MIIGEVCLQTNNVRKMADFYKKLLEIDTRQNTRFKCSIEF